MVDQVKINLWVKHIFREKLGNAFYNTLVDDLVDYSAATEYVPGQATVLNQIYTYEGIIYKNTQAITVGNTYLPPHKNYWALAPKFTTACLESFWCDYLSTYLSYFVKLREMTPTQYQDSAEGIVSKLTDNAKPVTQEEFNARMNYQRGLVDVAFKSLDEYIKLNYKTCTALATYKPLGVGCCSSCGEIDCSCVGDSVDDDEFSFIVA